MKKAVLQYGGAGLAIGAIAAWLVSQGNPGNMGVCIACFVRDIAGAFGGPSLNMGAVAYLRPEIGGLVLGALVAALATREFRPRGSAAFVLRFVIGFVFMCAALVFLGCTVRAWLRLGGGDLNAAVGVLGLAAGIGVGSAFLRAGYSLGRSRDFPSPAGWAVPAVAVVLVAVAAAASLGSPPAFLTITPAGVMPGGRHAPLLVSLLAGLAVGAIAQRSRLCTTGGIRDALLWRRFDKLFGVAGLVLGALVVNAIFGQFRLGFAGQPVSHTDSLANFAAMAVAGLAAVLMGGCPLRQVVMAGEGDVDAGGAIAGMAAGALFAHGARLASTAKGASPGGLTMLAVMALVLVGIGFMRLPRRAAAALGADPHA
jgi:hypothetical protein